MRLKRRGMLVLALLAFLAYVVYRGANRKSDFKYVYGPARVLATTGALNVGHQRPVSDHVPCHSRTPGGPAARCRGGNLGWVVDDGGRGSASDPAWPYGNRAAASTRRLGTRRALFRRCAVLGQSDPINLFLVACGLLAARKERGITAAGLIGLAGLIKLLPLFHWAYASVPSAVVGRLAGHGAACALGIGGLVAVVGWEPALDGMRTQAGLLREHNSAWRSWRVARIYVPITKASPSRSCALRGPPQCAGRRISPGAAALADRLAVHDLVRHPRRPGGRLAERGTVGGTRASPSAAIWQSSP